MHDGLEVVDEVRLGHANATIDDRERGGRLVRNDVDEELRLCIELTLVHEALEPDYVQGLQKSHLQTHHVSPGTNLAHHESNRESTDHGRI